MAISYNVPNVYYEPRPRISPRLGVRTDIAGFVGFEPRVRDGSKSSRLTGGTPPTGHRFQIDIAEFVIELDGKRETVPRYTNYLLSEDAASTLLNDGESIVYAIVAAKDSDEVILISTETLVQATPTGRHYPSAPIDEQVTTTVETVLGVATAWLRIADIEINRVGDHVNLLVRPALQPTRCDDWNDYLLKVGEVIDDGAFLGYAVRSYFANGGARCYISTVLRPRFEDLDGLARARDEMLGVQGASKIEATGVEALLLVDEVSVIDIPDLYARKLSVNNPTLVLPPNIENACFQNCDDFNATQIETTYQNKMEFQEPLYLDTEVIDTQKKIIQRVQFERWRAFFLASPPIVWNAAQGKYTSPEVNDAIAWGQDLSSLNLEEHEISCVALYFPWVYSQEQIDAPILELPPSSFAAGVIARRDLSRGPHVSPANELVRGVVGLTVPIDEDANGRLYEYPNHINVLRAFSGLGIQIWGARTLSEDTWFRYISVRRCLTAIEKRVYAALQPIVFESNTQFLWLRVTQIVFGVLLSVFESGALRGGRPDEAFFVRCDASNNPPEAIEEGRLLCEVGVAIAAPAEFIIFRVGRSEGVIEIEE